MRDRESLAPEAPFIPSLTGLNVNVYAEQLGLAFDPSKNLMSGQITATLNAPGGTCHIRFSSTDMGFAERTIVVPLNYTKRLGEGSLPSSSLGTPRRAGIHRILATQ